MTPQDTVLDFCRREQLLPQGGRVLAAVSGGADSMCMLRILLSLSASAGFSLTAAHLDHGLRGEASAEDAEFVRAYCRAQGIACICGRADVAAEARSTGLGTEEAARNARYAFLRSAAEQCGAAVIATAHTADDNAETMLMNLSRGTGLRGLCGIPVKRDGIIRPLLCLTRQQVEEWLSLQSIPHREDATNREDLYTRNRLRHHVLPALREIWPGAVTAFSEASLLLREDEAFLTGEALRFLDGQADRTRLPAKALAALPFPVASRVIRLCCPQTPELCHVRAVLELCGNCRPSAEICLPGIRVRREYGEIVFGGDEAPPCFDAVTLTGEAGQAELSGTGLRIRWRTVPKMPGIYKSFTSFFFKTEDICGKITVRSRQPGDRLVPAGTGCEKTVRKLMIERRIPAHQRGIFPIAADDAGVLAVYGIARAQRALPEPDSPALEIIFEESVTNDDAE